MTHSNVFFMWRSFKVATLLALTLAAFVTVFAATAVQALEPGEILKDPVLEARARVIGKQLRCVVCQNQSIDDSNAELAGDMRVLVRKRLTNGDTNAQVIAYMVDRYGDFVLLDPPFKGSTVVLWVAPGVIAVFAGLLLLTLFRRRTTADGTRVLLSPGPQAVPLSAEEQRRLDQILKEDNA